MICVKRPARFLSGADFGSSPFPRFDLSLTRNGRERYNGIDKKAIIA